MLGEKCEYDQYSQPRGITNQAGSTKTIGGHPVQVVQP
jgi:hypothetical protein